MSTEQQERVAHTTAADVRAPAGSAPVRFRDMHLKVGDRVQLEPPPHAQLGRLSSLVVGWVERQSLILTVPRTASGRLSLQPGELVVVRAFTGRSAYAFCCSVLRKAANPLDYLHLSFPEAIDGVDVRTSPRFRLRMPAKIAAKGATAVAALIDNMGATGASVACGEPLGRVGERIEVAFDLVLHDVPVALALQAEIRAVDAAGGVHRHGVCFVDPSPNDRLVLAAFVWFNMYENPEASM
jgi:hypothetical protein